MISLSTPRPHVALITLNRPERRNALDLAGFRALAGAWRSVAANAAGAQAAEVDAGQVDAAEVDVGQLRVAVVTGSADFSSGADLGSFPQDVAAALRGGEPPAQLWGDVHYALLRDAILPVPVVAAIEGYCLGAGMELVGATDIRIAGASATFALSEVRHGFIASGGSVARLPRQLGYAAAMQVLLTGARFDAERMREWGFVSEVVPDGSALSRALDVAEQIAANSPAAVSAIKRAVGEGLRGSLAEAFAIESRISAELT